MIVITRLRVTGDIDALDALVQAAVAALRARPGCESAQVGRNLDEPDLWVVLTRWADVGSYRRALSTQDVKMALGPLMPHVVDEPSAYELGDGGVWNLNIPR